jgi:hypothetical protein
MPTVGEMHDLFFKEGFPKTEDLQGGINLHVERRKE